MKTLLTLTFALITGTAATAEHFHVRTHDNPQFRDAIGNFLNLHRPELANIHCTLSGGIDFHLWVVPGRSNNRYNMEVIPTRNNTGWQTEVDKMISSGKAVPCAFNADAEVWMIEARH